MLALLCFILISFSASAGPKDTEATLKQAQVFAWNKEYARSEKIYREILSENPNNDEAGLGLSRILFWNNRLKESLGILNTLAEKHPADNEILSLRRQVKQALSDQNIFFVRSSVNYQHFSFFNNDSWGGKQFFSYTSPQIWAVRGSFIALSKFDTVSYQGILGGTYWITPRTILSLDAETAPGSAVLPIQAYTADISQSLWDTITPSFSYRFAQYQSANVNIVSPGLSLQLFSKLELKGKYYFTLSRFILQQNQTYGDTTQNSSGYISVVLTPVSWLQASLGYSLGSEAFDSGNPVLGLKTFSYQNVFGSAKFMIWPHFGIDFTFDQQFRNNGFQVTSGELGISYLW